MLLLPNSIYVKHLKCIKLVNFFIKNSTDIMIPLKQVPQLKESLSIKNKFLRSIKWSLYRGLGLLIIVALRHFSDQLLLECSNA